MNEVARLTYLSRGFNWAADYVAVFDEPRGTTSMQGWITLHNTSGTSFANARTQLVAGDVNLVDVRGAVVDELATAPQCQSALQRNRELRPPAAR